MASKLIIQFLALLFSFFIIWFLLSQINFLGNEQISELSSNSEEKLGEIILQSIQRNHDVLDDPELNAVMDTLIQRISNANEIDPQSIRLHVIDNKEVNAFALPDRNMVIYAGLIEYASAPEEVAGIMAHEIGHMEKNHIKEKLIKEIGLSMLFTVIAGDAGFEIIREVTKTVSSKAFDREQEEEADAYAVELLANAGIDPEHLANFLFRLSQDNEDIPAELYWLSTHPNSKDRAAEILQLKKDYKIEPLPLIQMSWHEVQQLIGQHASEEAVLIDTARSAD